MIETVAISEIEKIAENVYEAVIVMSKRARQINDEQKQLVMQEQDEYDEDYDAAFEEEREIIPSDIEYLKLPKPADVSLQEFLHTKLQYSYREIEPDGPDSE
jgi:DNA-directed RNA polymerase omega subunit